MVGVEFDMIVNGQSGGSEALSGGVWGSVCRGDSFAKRRKRGGIYSAWSQIPYVRSK